jgi:hypothetical protein
LRKTAANGGTPFCAFSLKDSRNRFERPPGVRDAHNATQSEPMVVERNRSSQLLSKQSDCAEAQTLTLRRVDIVGQTHAIVANFDCNRPVIV